VPALGTTFYKSQMDQLAFGIVPAFRRYELFHARYHEMLPVVAPLAARKGDALRILDVGSGMGDAKRFLDQLPAKPRWTGIEINPKRAQMCRALGYEPVIGALDLEEDPLPFADESFDLVIASHVLEHLEQAEWALQEWYRVLAPGGVLILGVPMHLPPVAWLARLKYRLLGRRPRGHCHFFSMGTLKRFLHGYTTRRIWGFRVLSARRQLPLEDYAWFYRASLWLGARLPGLTAEVNVHLEKPASTPVLPT
jgi:SAM-dependent methyltransferase